MPENINTFAVSPSDEPDIKWQFKRDPLDPDIRDDASVELEVEQAAAQKTKKEKLKTTEFEEAPSASLEIVGSLDELADLILSAVDFTNAARDGINKILKKIEDALRPFVNEQKKKHTAEVLIELGRNPDINGNDPAYIWVESTTSIFTNQGGGGTWTAVIELALNGTVTNDSKTHQRPGSFLATKNYCPFDPNDEIATRVVITSEVTLPSVADRFEEIWEQFKNSFRQFWESLQGGQAGEAFRQAVETWLGGQIQTLQLLTERRHARVSVTDNVTTWKLVDLQTLNRLIHRQSGFQPPQGTHGVGLPESEAVPQPRQTFRRAVEDAEIERVDPEEQEKEHENEAASPKERVRREKQTKYFLEIDISK